MQTKKKICVSCKNETYIWSKSMCKSCFMQNNPNKPLKKSYISKKLTEKQIAKKVIKTENTKKQFEFFKEIWKERPHYCNSCNKYLGEEPLSLYFDHLIEKSLRDDLRFVKENIYICCGDCHSAKTNGFPKPLHKEAIYKIKQKYEIS